MTTDDLKQLLENKSLRAEFEVGETGLRVFLQDLDTGQVGLLAIEAQMLVLPDEAKLVYSYQDISAELGPSEHLYDIATRIDPDFPKGTVPFLFD